MIKYRQSTHPKTKKPRYVPDLKHDLASCDANYIRFLRLFPSYATEDALSFGLEFGQATVEIRLQVTERCPYTTFVDIRVENEGAYLSSLLWPSLTVGLYHDLSTAEVLAIVSIRSYGSAMMSPTNRCITRTKSLRLIAHWANSYRFVLREGECLKT